jgi:poly-gamma-glutamate synthesis protein (capsule biosynthesis protein)
MANNHVLDVGYKAMLENIARLHDQGILTCGAGANPIEAREPAVVERHGIRIAFLAYCCAFPAGYEARHRRPGLAPMRYYRYARDVDPSDVNMAPEFVNLPDRADLAALRVDIRRARSLADLVAVSFHWGDYTRKHTLSVAERELSRLCVDLGADLIIGQGHHVLRGIEWYKSKPVFYGMGHFALDLRWEWTPDLINEIAQYENVPNIDYRIEPRQGWPLLPMHDDARMTVLAWANANKDGICNIGILPCRLTQEGVVQPLLHGTGEFEAVRAYVSEGHAVENIKSELTIDGAPVIGGYQTLRVISTESQTWCPSEDEPRGIEV